MMHAKRVIRVLVVDDSAFMRRAIAKMLAAADDITVVGMASTGEEAVAMQPELKPDVITMDVEMPGMGGLEAARAIIARRGPPIIMISSLTRDGAETTLRALEIGAADFIPKPDSATTDILRVKDDLDREGSVLRQPHDHLTAHAASGHCVAGGADVAAAAGRGADRSAAGARRASAGVCRRAHGRV